MKEDADLLIRPTPTPAYLFAALSALVFISSFFRGYERADQLLLALFLFIVSAAFWFIFRLSFILVTKEGLSNKTSTGKKNVTWNSIAKTFITYRASYTETKIYLYFITHAGEYIRFSIRYYSLKELQQLATMIIERKKDAIADDKLFTLAEGKLPWK